MNPENICVNLKGNAGSGRTMLVKEYVSYSVLLALFLATSLALAFCVGGGADAKPGVRLELPDRIGQWVGADIYYCHNEKCLKVFVSASPEGFERCPSCGGVLKKTWSLGESRILPNDTILVKKRYVHPSGNAVTVSVVVSGRESVSIHRPQICLVGQGLEISGERTLGVDLGGDKMLKVMVLDVLQRKNVGGRLVVIPGYYAYWFVGNGRETPYHSARMFYTAIDRLFRNVNPRWSYISVSGTAAKGCEGSWRDEIRDFVKQLYPHIMAE